MSTGIPFQAFLLRHQYTPERAFLDEFPLGCLLDSANPTASSQRGARIYPLVKPDAPPVVTGASIAITSVSGEDVGEMALRARIVVGRDPARADVVVPGEGVAPVHAYFFLRRGRLHLADCGAPGGTYVAGQPLRGGQRVPLKPETITELWFGEEGFFHFDPRSLFSYVHYLLGTREERPDLRAERRPAAPATGPDEPETDVVHVELGAARQGELDARGDSTAPTDRLRPPSAVEPAAPLPAPAAPPPDAWQSGLLALRQLAPNLQAVRVHVEQNADPVTLFDADARHDLDVALRALEGMRPVVTSVNAQLRRSRFRLTVFQR